MNRKILGIFVMTMLIAVSVSSVTGIIDENETLNMENDDYHNLIKQVIKSGVISKNDWLEQDKLLASDGAAEDHFGWSVSIDGDYALVGAYLDDDNGRDSGSAYVFKRSGTTWTEEAKLTASDGAEQDRFGISVSIDGDYALIGAYLDEDNGANSGSSYIFKFNNPPNTPDINGPDSGEAGEEYNYTFKSVDPDGDNVQFYIEWGDDNESTEFVGSDEDITISHNWTEEDTYTIRVKAKDVKDAESDWATLEVAMPKNKIFNTPFLQFLENHPHLFPLLRQLLGLQ